MLPILIFLIIISGCQSTTDETTSETQEPMATTIIEESEDPSAMLDGSGGGLITFENEKIGNFDYELYVMNADGSALTKLTDNPAFDGGPSFSPDAKKIAFTSTRNGKMDIYIYDLEAFMNGDVTEPVRLTNEGNNYCPAWAPDNSAIAFTTDREGGFKIYKMSIDGSNQQLFIDLPDAFNPAWSADSKKLVFNAKADGSNELHKIDSDGENIVRLTNHNGDDQFADWSPDGETIAYSRNEMNTQFYICSIDKNGENFVELLVSYDSDEYPIWSPDGSQILCRSSITGSDQLIIMDKDGSNSKAVTDMQGTSMDCDWIAFNP